jgi:hypothetical protein
MLPLSVGYPNTQEVPVNLSGPCPFVSFLKKRRDLAIYVFSWLEASTLARCQSVARCLSQAQENKEGFIESAAKIAPKLRKYRYNNVVGVQLSRGICATRALSVLEALVVPLLYVVGGYNSRRLQTQRTLKRFLPWLNNYKILAPLLTPRRELGACLVGNELFAIGGVYGLNALSTVERYNPIRNSWQELAKMKHARRACAATSLNGKVYAIGGYSLARSMSEVERFDPANNKWEEIGKMNRERSGACAACACGSVFVFGGGNNAKTNDGTWAFTTAERYDEVANKWHFIAEMKNSRRGATAATIGNKIYIRGGKNNKNEDVTCFECYDPISDSWKEVEHISPPTHYDVFERRLVMEFERADGVDMTDGIAASGCLAITPDFNGI